MANADYKYILFAEDGKHELSITEKTEAVPRKHLGNVYEILDEELAPVAFDNDYDSLYNKPSIPSFTRSQLIYLKDTLPAAIQFDSNKNPVFQDKRLVFNNLKNTDGEIGFLLGSKCAVIYPHMISGKTAFSLYGKVDASSNVSFSFLDIIYDSEYGVIFKPIGNASVQSSFLTFDGSKNLDAVTITNSDDKHEKIFTFCCRPEKSGNADDNAKIVKFVSGNVECESVILKSSTPATYGAQIAFDDNKSGLVKVRGKAGDWGPWFTLLHSGDYTDYTVTKTGSGASGTWGISITGNAASATKLATARTISLTGSVTGSGTFDGSGNLSIATTTNHTHNYAGSSSAGGSANSAVKLDTATAGDSNTPVYFSGGKPVACTSLDLNTSGNAATASKVNNKLTVGSKSYDGSAAVTIAASDLGLASAMLFLGTTTTAITDGATTNPVVLGGSNKTVTAGNVVLYGSKEFVWTGRAWEELGNEGSYKIVQAAVADPSASGTSNTFIATISQDTNGKITATKKTVAVTNSAPTLAWGATSTVGTVAGTNLQVKMPANPNTDTKVTQTAINAADYTNWRPLIWGSSNSGTEGFTPSTVTDGVYTAQTLSCQPSTGTIRAITFKGSLSGNADTATKFTAAQSITLTGDTTGTASSKAGWSIGTTTSKLSNAGHLNTAEKLDAFIEANKLKYATVAAVDGVTSDGMIISVPWSSSSWGHQIFLDDSAMVMQHRHRYTKTNSDGSTAQAWSGWATLLDSNNYNNYTVTKTGGGASGTWSISVTGSSASCTGKAATATKLATARTIRTNLASTSAASFDGSANITPGVTGTLPIANGGTGATTASAARNNLGAQSKVLYGSSAPSDSTGSNGDMYIALESGDFKKDIVDLIYPVGSIYISMNSADPSTLFGGTWEAFGQGRVLIGAGTGDDGSTSLSFTAGGTGGEYKHDLLTGEMPSHTHSFRGTTAANNHSHTHSYTKATGVRGHKLTEAEIPAHTHAVPNPGYYAALSTPNTGFGAFAVVNPPIGKKDGYSTGSIGGNGSHNHELSTSSATSGSESQNHTHTFSGTTGNAGSGSPHNNIQPYIVVYMWKRTA